MRPDPASASSAPRLAIANLIKTFGRQRALDRVSFAVAPAEIHGLLGQNGSGKSTLIKVLSGFYAPDGGELTLDGQAIALPVPVTKLEEHGLAFVHQNLGLLADATVLENFIAGEHRRINRWRLDWRAEARRARALFERHALELDPNAPVAALSPVRRAQLAIVRAAARVQAGGAAGRFAAGGLLVLDEPTPFLPASDVEDLFTLLRQLVGQGTSIVFVSHDIDEVMALTERATVLRDGRVSGSFVTSEMSRAEIVEMIVGEAPVARAARARGTRDESLPRIEISGLDGTLGARAGLALRRGEIVGLTGLIGSGHDALPYVLGGASPTRSGTLTIDGESIELRSMTPARALAAGVVLVPSDRQNRALAGDLSVLENLVLPLVGASGERWRLRHRRLRARAGAAVDRFGVRLGHLQQPGAELSGGNQQKVVLAKWLQLDPVLVLLDEPTQGIDVGARAEIYAILDALVEAGACVLCASSEFDQLELIAHRVLVFERGRVAAELVGPEVTKVAIAKACYSETNGTHVER